jgi:hypothetical protein
MRQVAAGEILISYSQICAFDPSLDRPFNDWTPRHAVQGFAWRPGSVAFRVDEDAGDGGVVRVRVSVATSPPDVVGAAGAVRVPFEAPAEGAVEIASISESLPAKVPPGRTTCTLSTVAQSWISFSRPLPGEGRTCSSAPSAPARRRRI